MVLSNSKIIDLLPFPRFNLYPNALGISRCALPDVPQSCRIRDLLWARQSLFPFLRKILHLSSSKSASPSYPSWSPDPRDRFHQFRTHPKTILKRQMAHPWLTLRNSGQYKPLPTSYQFFVRSHQYSNHKIPLSLRPWCHIIRPHFWVEPRENTAKPFLI